MVPADLIDYTDKLEPQHGSEISRHQTDKLEPQHGFEISRHQFNQFAASITGVYCNLKCTHAHGYKQMHIIAPVTTDSTENTDF